MGELDESRARLTSDYTKHNGVKSFLNELPYFSFIEILKTLKTDR